LYDHFTTLRDGSGWHCPSRQETSSKLALGDERQARIIAEVTCKLAIGVDDGKAYDSHV
jgi:hypothetical protein